MPGNEADRIARQRALQQQRQVEEAQATENQKVIARLRSYVRDIEREIPIVLRLLAARGHPEVGEVRFENARHPNPMGASGHGE
jgi:hypothetical protein